MGGFADKHRQKENENKATEYAELKKEISELKTFNGNLKSEIEELKGTIGSLTEALKEITPKKIEEVQKAGEHIFDPIKQTATELNRKIKAAGEEATERVRNAGEKSLPEYLLQGAVTAAWYVLITFLVIQWGIGMKEIKSNVDYTADRVKVIHYNQTTGREYGTYDMWHMEEFYDKWHEIDKQLDKTGK